jgi:hypothetical protein
MEDFAELRLLSADSNVLQAMPVTSVQRAGHAGMMGLV